MKKLTSLLLLTIMIFSFSFSSLSCGYGFERVHSVTSSYGTVKSTYYFRCTRDYISEEEYRESKAHGKYILSEGEITIDGKIKEGNNYGSYDLTVADIKKIVGKTYTYASNNGYSTTYLKITYDKLIISYVKVKPLSDGSFILQYKDKSNFTITQRIKSDTYKITYFYD